MVTLSDINGLVSPKRKSTKSSDEFYNIPIKELFSYVLKNRLQEGEVGLEIECEGTNLFRSPISYWRCLSDHSLRSVDGQPPVEYVLQKPLNRVEVSKALEYLTVKLKQSESLLSMSTRTSVHVHINMQKNTFEEVVKFLCLYYIFETMLVDFSGADRSGNFFCLRAIDSESQILELEKALKENALQDLCNDNYRYCSCNYTSLSKFGSIEFRSLRGTVSKELIETWIDLLLNLKTKALSFKSPREIAESFLSSPEAFFQNIWGHNKNFSEIFTRHNDMIHQMWGGFRLMRDVAYSIKWKPKLPKKQVKEIKVEWLEELRSGVWIRSDDTGLTWLENYNLESATVTLQGRLWELESRFRYLVDIDSGAYKRQREEIGEDEFCP